MRVSSLAALIAAAVTPIFFLYWWSENFDPWTAERDMLLYAALTFLLAGLIFVTHRTNIGRLLAGTEPRIGRS
jgi:glycerol-3-phosphate acyltransferase PlsY